MNFENFIAAFSKYLDQDAGKNTKNPSDLSFVTGKGDVQDFIVMCEKAMVDAGFTPAQSEEVLDTIILPNLAELREKFRETDARALDIYRAAGLDEMKIRWRNFSGVRLNRIQRRKIDKISRELEELGDLQLVYGYMYEVILKYRPALEEKYGLLEMLTMEGF